MLTLTLILPARLHPKTPMECLQLTSRVLFLSTSTQNVLTFQKTFVTSVSDLSKTKKFNLSKKTKCQYSRQRTVNITVLILSILKSKTISNQLKKKASTGSLLTSMAQMEASSNLQEQLKETESLLNSPTSSSKNSSQKRLEWTLPK